MQGDLVRKLAAIDQRGRMTEQAMLLLNRQDRVRDLDTFLTGLKAGDTFCTGIQFFTLYRGRNTVFHSI